jgi:hypothetical protein
MHSCVTQHVQHLIMRPGVPAHSCSSSPALMMMGSTLQRNREGRVCVLMPGLVTRYYRAPPQCGAPLGPTASSDSLAVLLLLLLPLPLQHALADTACIPNMITDKCVMACTPAY